MADLRIFSYQPNPRIWKATIAARLCGVSLEVRGARPRELASWLWDFDARPLTEAERQSPDDTARAARTGFSGSLRKTDAFLTANPFGTVPVAFSPDGRTGIFESNSIMRAVARLAGDAHPLYGADAYTAARVDSFLDVSLVFARDSQIYLLAMNGDGLTAEIHASAEKAFEIYLSGIEQALAPDRHFLVGDEVTLADICFVAEICLFSRERANRERLRDLDLPVISDGAEARFPRAMAHHQRLSALPAFAPDVGPYMAKLEADIARADAG